MLSGVTVLDLTRVLAGPWATQTLADLGAEVIKVERPGLGDDTRSWGPPWLEEPHGRGRESAYFLSTNRGKKSIAVDLKSPCGQGVIRKIAENADIFVENFKVGELAALGLGYDAIRDINPRIVYCSITGFGQNGPRAKRAGYDAMIQAMGGLMSITGEADGPPQKVGVAAADLMCGMYATSGILAALFQAQRTGKGAYIDLALFDTQLAWLANQASAYLVSGVPPGRHGNGHPSIVPYQTFACSDGPIMLAIGNDAQFRRLCSVVERVSLAEDPRFATNEARVAHRDILTDLLQPIIASHPRSHWQERCDDHGIPCGPVQSVAEALNDPQAQARECVQTVPHPYDESLRTVRNPLRMSGESADRTPPPLLGQHTREILAEYGYSKSTIEKMLRDDVVE